MIVYLFIDQINIILGKLDFETVFFQLEWSIPAVFRVAEVQIF